MQYLEFTKNRLEKLVIDMLNLGFDERSIKSVLLVVPFKRGRGTPRVVALQTLADSMQETRSYVKMATAGYEVGVYVSLYDCISSDVSDGEVCFVEAEGGNDWKVGDLHVSFDTDDLAMSRGWFIDSKGHAHRNPNRLLLDLQQRRFWDAQRA